jgi:tRNA (guanine37-N1)-methyltransferase
MRLDVMTLFPEIFSGYLRESLIKKALDHGLIDIQLHDIRNWTHDKHNTVDDRPYGGGPGMVLKVEPVVESIEAVQARCEPKGEVILLTPTGRTLSQRLAEDLASRKRLILVCGRYEGFDQRIIDLLEPMELSIGDYVLNGGETAAMVVIDVVSRLIPGVLGDQRSSRDDSFSQDNRLLEGAQYTRPREYRGLCVPEVLVSGNHPEIAKWRKEQSEQRTRNNRADLLDDC